mgnify:CR=1 FL=1
MGAHVVLTFPQRYLAGVDLLYDREQSTHMLRRVSLQRRRELARLSARELGKREDVLHFDIGVV